MGRTYKRKVGSRVYKNFSDENIDKALEKIVNENWSINKASKEFKISYGTLYNKYKGMHVRSHGGQPVFTKQEEDAIIRSVVICSDWGFPLCIEDLQMVTKSFLDRQGRQVTRFKNNIPGRDWVYSLIKRHKASLTQRLAANIKRARASVSPEVIRKYFENLQTSTHDVPPSNMFNYDETNMADDPGKKKWLYRRGKKYPENIINHSKSAISIMFCGSASGVLLPPYVIYKSEHLWDRWTENGPKGHPCCEDRCCSSGSRYNRTKSGWIEASCFTDWFRSTFLPHAMNLPGKKVLIGDNLSSHFTDEVLELCNDNNIVFLCLPPNSTHLTQPLDVSFFRPLKTAWRSVLLDWKMKNPKQSSLKKEIFPQLMQITLEKMNSSGTHSPQAINHDLKSGFEATGIFPLNPDKILNKIPNAEDNGDQFGADFDNNLVLFLKKKRYNSTPIRNLQKKKRLTVEAGKSVAYPTNESDENEEIDRISLNLSDVHEDAHSDVADEVDYLPTDPEKILPGIFILVKVLSGNRNCTKYRYVAKVKGQVGENDYNVLGLKSLDTTKTTFKAVPNDLFTVSLEDIIAILEQPSETSGGRGARYVFPNSVDVFER